MTGDPASRPPPPESGRSEFRRLMARWPTGVSVVTASGPAGDVGLTVNAFLSVSLDPPQVLISLGREADSTAVIEATGRFAINLLAHDQRSVSERFARTVVPEEKFRDLPLDRSAAGLPLLRGTLGAIEAMVVQRIPASDHLLFVGEVTALHPGRDVPPLVYYRSAYAESDGARRLDLPAPRG